MEGPVKIEDEHIRCLPQPVVDQMEDTEKGQQEQREYLRAPKCAP